MFHSGSPVRVCSLVSSGPSVVFQLLASKEKSNEWQSALTLLSTFQSSADSIACSLDVFLSGRNARCLVDVK